MRIHEKACALRSRPYSFHLMRALARVRRDCCPSWSNSCRRAAACARSLHLLQVLHVLLAASSRMKMIHRRPGIVMNMAVAWGYPHPSARIPIPSPASLDVRYDFRTIPIPSPASLRTGHIRASIQGTSFSILASGRMYSSDPGPRPLCSIVPASSGRSFIPIRDSPASAAKSAICGGSRTKGKGKIS